MEVTKIVFTGGPCAGKTTLIEKTKEYLIKNNYNVIVVPETATILKESGININLLESTIDFQNLILKMQIFNENIADKVTEIKKIKILLYFMIEEF